MIAKLLQRHYILEEEKRKFLIFFLRRNLCRNFFLMLITISVLAQSKINIFLNLRQLHQVTKNAVIANGRMGPEGLSLWSTRPKKTG